ncbi:MAG: delta-lactam-biosynthetic de-N-acetylase, partial [Firmicutes bacterium]|nr:delta-lactam-biosynthetic de-N-acetylase [Bacillota bacterium]
TVFWSLAYVDWLEDQQPTREEALNTLNARIHKGAVVLLHSTSKTNSQILQELIKGWKQQGYTFAPIDKLIL